MAVCWVAGVGLVASVIAVPVGVAVHRHVLPAMAHSADLGLPASYLNVYRGWELAPLALAGVVIAVAGALLPAGWAAGIRTRRSARRSATSPWRPGTFPHRTRTGMSYDRSAGALAWRLEEAGPSLGAMARDGPAQP
jgi:hypothetical protein